VKQVFTSYDITEAHFVRGLLESHGLEVALRGEDLWVNRGELPFVETWPTVWVVDDAHEAEARRIIVEYQSARGDRSGHPADWRCRTCGQDVEPQFTACWSCGTERAL
jgi:hypothetical protein